MPEPLPPFPVDPVTLDAIEAAIGAAVPDDRAAATAITDDVTDAETANPIVGLDALLELFSAYTGGGTVDDDNGCHIVHIGPLYSREDVILALITEVRRLRELAERLLPQARA